MDVCGHTLGIAGVCVCVVEGGKGGVKRWGLHTSSEVGKKKLRFEVRLDPLAGLHELVLVWLLT